MLQATRTLVKSGPELWAEVADSAALEAHLSPFGPISIQRTEPERLVAWSAERVSGTLELESAGFGTRVRLRAAADVEPPAPEPTPAPTPRPSRWARLLRRRPPAAPSAPEPIPVIADDRVLEVLGATLDALGAAHHRPFSRA